MKNIKADKSDTRWGFNEEVSDSNFFWYWHGPQKRRSFTMKVIMSVIKLFRGVVNV